MNPQIAAGTPRPQPGGPTLPATQRSAQVETTRYTVQYVCTGYTSPQWGTWHTLPKTQCSVRVEATRYVVWYVGAGYQTHSAIRGWRLPDTQDSMWAQATSPTVWYMGAHDQHTVQCVGGCYQTHNK